MIRKKMVLLCIWVVLLCGAIPCYGQDTLPQEKVEMIFLLDTSGSMKTTDPNQMVPDRIRYFIDLLRAETVQVGFVGYNSQVSEQAALQDISMYAAGGELQAVLNGLAYRGNTDLSAGLQRAVELLPDKKTGQEAAKQVILLFSDGAAYSSGNADKQKTVQEQLNQILTNAKERGIIIEVVAIGQEAAEQSNLLFEAAGATGGTIYTAQALSELDRLLQILYEKYFLCNVIHTQTVDIQKGLNQLEVPIPSAAFDQMRLSLTATVPVEQMKLFGQADQMILHSGRYYEMVDIAGLANQSLSLQFQSSRAGTGAFTIYLASAFKPQVALSYETGNLQDQRTNFSISLLEGARAFDLEDVVIGAMEAKVSLTPYSGQSTGEGLIEMSGPITLTGQILDNRIIVQEMVAPGQYLLQVTLEGQGMLLESRPALITVMDALTPAKEQRQHVRNQRMFWVITIVIGIALLYGAYRMKLRMTTIAMEQEEEAKRLFFSGKLNCYLTNNDDVDEDFPPIVEYLYQRNEKTVTLQQIINEAAVLPAFQGADQIILRPGPKNNLIIRNLSDCTIIRSHEIIERNREALVEYDETLYITSADKQYEMTIYYKSSRPY